MKQNSKTFLPKIKSQKQLNTKREEFGSKNKNKPYFDNDDKISRLSNVKSVSSLEPKIKAKPEYHYHFHYPPPPELIKQL